MAAARATADRDKSTEDFIVVKRWLLKLWWKLLLSRGCLELARR
jgi:hypothetical protein